MSFSFNENFINKLFKLKAFIYIFLIKNSKFLHIHKTILYADIYVVMHSININVFLLNIYLQFTMPFYTFTKYKNFIILH